MATATITSTGSSTRRPSADPTTSNMRFTTIVLSNGYAGIQRQRNRTLEVAASDRKLALLAMIALLPVCHLMQWPIVDRCADTFLCKARDQIVAIGPRTLTDPYRKHVPGMKAAGGSGSRTVDRPIRQFPEVAFGGSLP